MNMRRLGWLLMLLLATFLFLALARPALAAGPVDLALEAPDQLNLGDEVVITAALKDSSGAPIPGATVVLWTPGQFLSVEGVMELGRAATDAQGLAVFLYQARSEKSATLNVSFSGDSRYSPAHASLEVSVAGSAQLYQSTAGVRLPGVGVWLLVAALGTAWSIYIGMMVLVTLIARAGQSASEELGGANV
ncbi:MAG: hypothetical protein HY532_07230 [Chloroflexi bacterium]|nr:hypothetical protein [Chloroflexota bacterium]